ncbi:MAG TPA: Ig-like domain-containing protein, partial [Verrucomicrobiae bacterium]|nr:Ig-like domain-containing protein [Verrucomicrobiae bacterium]
MSFRSWRRFFLGAILPQFFATQSAFSAGPALQIRIGQSGTVQINWANDPAAVLESISPLAVPGGWQPVSDQPSLDGGLLSITLRAGDTSRFFRLRTTAGLTTIIETSPVDGEGDVAVTRDTIMRLSSPLAANTILTSDHFYATSGGRKLLTRVELSSDRRTVTLFYLEPIPGSARVSVVLDASEIFDAQGKLLDADGDGAPGGVKRLIFDTLSITPVPQTAVVGRVFAAEQIRIGGNL